MTESRRRERRTRFALPQLVSGCDLLPICRETNQLTNNLQSIAKHNILYY